MLKEIAMKEFDEMKKKMLSGWNTWYNNSVLDPCPVAGRWVTLRSHRSIK
jgi:hypothetical protein